MRHWQDEKKDRYIGWAKKSLQFQSCINRVDKQFEPEVRDRETRYLAQLIKYIIF